MLKAAERKHRLLLTDHVLHLPVGNYFQKYVGPSKRKASSTYPKLKALKIQ